MDPSCFVSTNQASAGGVTVWGLFPLIVYVDYDIEYPADKSASIVLM